MAKLNREQRRRNAKDRARLDKQLQIHVQIGLDAPASPQTMCFGWGRPTGKAWVGAALAGAVYVAACVIWPETLWELPTAVAVGLWIF